MKSLTVPLLLEQQAANLGSRTAVIANDGTGNYRSVSFSGLLEYADQVASALSGLLDPDRESLNHRRVCWSFDNSNGLVALVLFHAVLRMGGVNVPINPGSSPEEMNRLVDSVDAAIVVAPKEKIIDVPPATTSLAISSFDDLLEFATAAGSSESRVALPEDPSVILFTSGTTGRSKGVVHSHSSALAAGRGWAEAFELSSGDTYQSMYSLYSGGGLHFNGLACLWSGSTFLVDESRPTRASLHRVDQFGSTVYAAVPSVYQYWFQEDISQLELRSLRLLNVGGAVMHRATIEALRSFVPGVSLMQTYGLTEAGPGGLFLPPELFDLKLGAIGSKPIRGLRIQLDTAVEMASSQHENVGELLFSGSSLMLGYLDDPVGTESVFDGEWLRTGDLVRIDEDGCVFFLDRLKDLIIRGGFNISTVEIEEALLQYPGVREVAAFGYPHDSLGEVVAVAIVPDNSGDFDVDGLRQFAEQKLARVKIPERIAVLDAIPLSAAGKVLKSALRANPNLVPWGKGKANEN